MRCGRDVAWGVPRPRGARTSSRRALLSSQRGAVEIGACRHARWGSMDRAKGESITRSTSAGPPPSHLPIGTSRKEQPLRHLGMTNLQVLSHYRELLRLIKRLPRREVEAALAEARAGVRANAGEADEAKSLDQLKELAGRISFLRMTVPRRPGDASRGSGHFVLREGELVEGRGVADSRVADGIMDWATAHQVHKRQMKRFCFGKNPVKGQLGPF
mmetsp:Transcript_4107/g.12902  ORF Transcript_4107/g.12902 Transcript_4107/m.12902 type:complete len:216 (+) Transcript_4107:1588-2235(+)